MRYVLPMLFTALLSIGSSGCKITHTPESNTESDLQFLRKALEKYKSDSGRLPSQQEGLDALLGRYVAEEYGLKDAWFHRAVYRHVEAAAGESESFIVYSIGKNGIDEQGLGDDIVVRSKPSR